jgi:hypothetical protein
MPSENIKKPWKNKNKTNKHQDKKTQKNQPH